MNILTCNNLGFMTPSKRSPNILRHISFELPQGARLALIGGNGAGKSTLLKLLLGLAPIGEGSASIFDRAVPSVESRENIGYLADEAAPFPHLTGKEYLALFGQLEGLSGNVLKETVDNALERAGLTIAANTRTDRYSKGMRQRLEIERTLLVERKLLFLDEPLTGLDLESQLTLKRRLKELSDDGVSMVLTSHEPSILESICTHVALLRLGELVTFGTFDELLSKKGWQITFTSPEHVPRQLPEGAVAGKDKSSIIFNDYTKADTVLSQFSGKDKIASFGTAIKGIEDLLEEVTVS